MKVFRQNINYTVLINPRTSNTRTSLDMRVVLILTPVLVVCLLAIATEANEDTHFDLETVRGGDGGFEEPDDIGEGGNEEPSAVGEGGNEDYSLGGRKGWISLCHSLTVSQ